VRVVNFAKLFGTLVAAILTAVAILATFSQLSGYSAYTGDELESHRAERIRKEIEDAQRDATKEESPPDTASPRDPQGYEECLGNPDYQIYECEERFGGP